MPRLADARAQIGASMADIVKKIKSEFDKSSKDKNGSVMSKGATGATRDAQRRVLSELDFSDR